MDDFTALGNGARSLRRRIVVRPGMAPRSADHGSAAGLDDGMKGLLHVRGHFHFVLAPRPVKAQHGNAPLVFYFRVGLAEALVVGNHLAASAESDDGAIRAAALLLQADAIAFLFFAHTIEATHAGQVASAAE